jgi:hypothetical protein
MAQRGRSGCLVGEGGPHRAGDGEAVGHPQHDALALALLLAALLTGIGWLASHNDSIVDRLNQLSSILVRNHMLAGVVCTIGCACALLLTHFLIIYGGNFMLMKTALPAQEVITYLRVMEEGRARRGRETVFMVSGGLVQSYLSRSSCGKSVSICSLSSRYISGAPGPSLSSGISSMCSDKRAGILAARGGCYRKDGAVLPPLPRSPACSERRPSSATGPLETVELGAEPRDFLFGGPGGPPLRSCGLERHLVHLIHTAQPGVIVGDDLDDRQGGTPSFTRS